MGPSSVLLPGTLEFLPPSFSSSQEATFPRYLVGQVLSFSLLVFGVASFPCLVLPGQLWWFLISPGQASATKYKTGTQSCAPRLSPGSQNESCAGQHSCLLKPSSRPLSEDSHLGFEYGLTDTSGGGLDSPGLCTLPSRAPVARVGGWRGTKTWCCVTQAVSPQPLPSSQSTKTATRGQRAWCWSSLADRWKKDCQMACFISSTVVWTVLLIAEL